MAQLPDGSFLYSLSEQPWHSFYQTPEDKIQILHIDEEAQQVVFVQRFGPNARHSKHTHHCTAVAYTLRGEWEYDGMEIGDGQLAFEPFGSTHTPATGPETTANVLVILTSITGDGRLLELHGEDGSSFELDMEVFKTMASMTPEAFLEYTKSFEAIS